MNAIRHQEDFTYFEITRTAENDLRLQRMLDTVRHLGATVLDPEISPAVIEHKAYGSDINPDDDHRSAHINGIKSSRLKVYDPENIKLPLLRYRIPSSARHVADFRRTAQRVMYDLDLPDVSQHDRRKGRPPGELRKRLMQISLRYDVMEGENTFLPPLRCSAASFIREPYTGQKELVLIPDARQRLVLLLLEQAGECFDGYHKYSQGAAVLASAISVNIPIARIPDDISESEQDLFIDTMAKEALPARITLGSIKRRANDEA